MVIITTNNIIYQVQAQIVPPELSSHLFSEKLLYLPYTYQSNDMPLFVMPYLSSDNDCDDHDDGDIGNSHAHDPDRKSTTATSVPSLSKASRKRKSSSRFGISPAQAKSYLICSFNANKKMEPVSMHTWINILRRIPSSMMVLLDLLSDAKKYVMDEMKIHGR